MEEAERINDCGNEHYDGAGEAVGEENVIKATYTVRL
jgi:hypothetical protein